MAGAQLQGPTRNPLADPGLLGVSAGAALAIVSTSTILGVGGATGQAWAALLGALAATAVVWLLAGSVHGGTSPLPLALAGVALTALLTSLTTVLVLLDADILDEYRFWAVGSLAGRDVTLLRSVAPFLVVGLLLAVAGSRTLDLLALGDDLAKGLGARLAWGRGGVALSATLLTAASVAVAGPLVFVGLVVPHLARALVGPSHRWLLPQSAVLGAALLLVSDVLGWLVAQPFVGAAFGLAGALTSSVVRNPLATPDVVGVTAGASAAAVGVILLGWPVPLPLAAVAGGVLVAVLVGALSWRDGFTGPRLVLVGIGLGASAAAFTSFLLVRAEITDAQRAVLWLTGSLNGRGWEHVRPVALAVVLLVPLGLALGRGLSLLRLGDDVALGLGARVTRVRLGLVAIAVALASVATASAGPVVFVALVAPQVALRLARTGPPLAASAAAGALLVVAADLVARTGLAAVGRPSTELPVGAVTALVGAPVLLWLLRRSTRGRTT